MDSTGKIQKRKDEGAEPPNGLLRRATDNDLRGMKVLDDDSEATWAAWQEASSGPGDLPDEQNTTPLPLNPG